MLRRRPRDKTRSRMMQHHHSRLSVLVRLPWDIVVGGTLGRSSMRWACTDLAWWIAMLSQIVFGFDGPIPMDVGQYVRRSADWASAMDDDSEFRSNRSYHLLVMNKVRSSSKLDRTLALLYSEADANRGQSKPNASVIFRGTNLRRSQYQWLGNEFLNVHCKRQIAWLGTTPWGFSRYLAHRQACHSICPKSGPRREEA